MAIFTPGPAVGQISGRVGGTVFSHNRGGPYMRNGVIPTASHTAYAEAAKARLTSLSRTWAAVGADDKTAWRTWAQNNPITNRLGNQVTLAPHMAYMQINNRLLAAGDAVIDIPPLDPAPAPLLTLSAALGVIAGTCILTFTATPLAADLRLWTEAALVSGAGISYVQNLFKNIDISAKALATDVDLIADLEARFGSIIEGQVLHLRCATFDSTTGLLSAPLIASATVAA